MSDITYRTKIVDGHEVCFGSEWIYELEREIYFNWYYHQAEIVYSNCKRDDRLLEIGLGTGLLSDLLKRRGWNIKTLDIDEEKRPDYCASAIDFDYENQGVDTVLAFEIFEHIPLATFKKFVDKISTSSIKNVYFSLPWNQRNIINFQLKLPKLPPIILNMSIPKDRITTRAHFWELSKKDKALGDKELVGLGTLNHIFSERGYKVIPQKKIGYIQYFLAEK